MRAGADLGGGTTVEAHERRVCFHCRFEGVTIAELVVGDARLLRFCHELPQANRVLEEVRGVEVRCLTVLGGELLDEQLRQRVQVGRASVEVVVRERPAVLVVRALRCVDAVRGELRAHDEGLDASRSSLVRERTRILTVDASDQKLRLVGLDLGDRLRVVTCTDSGELVEPVERQSGLLDLGENVLLDDVVDGATEIPANETDGLLVRVRLLEPLEHAREGVVRGDCTGAPEERLSLTEDRGSAATVEGEHVVLGSVAEHRTEVVNVRSELHADALGNHLGHCGDAGSRVARLVVPVLDGELGAASFLDELDGEVDTAAHGLAVERAGARQCENRAEVALHASQRVVPAEDAGEVVCSRGCSGVGVCSGGFRCCSGLGACGRGLRYSSGGGGLRSFLLGSTSTSNKCCSGGHGDNTGQTLLTRLIHVSP
uniref:Unannotated protein n=1 Tax=freshwater metagenome TaxID=449393 RepID=A0A6J7PCC2_9ZZZZ